MPYALNAAHAAGQTITAVDVNAIAAAVNASALHSPVVTVVASTATTQQKADADFVCTGTNDHTTIQAALDTGLVGGAGFGVTVRLGPGQYNVAAPILVRQRAHLLGAASSAEPNGTGLVLANGANCDVLQTEGTRATATPLNAWWHSGEIAYLHINGNKANNTWGHGINVGSMGEAAWIHNCIVTQCALDGVHVYGGTPNFLAWNMSTLNGRHGYNVSNYNEACLLGCSGDDNVGSLIRLNNAAGGNTGGATVIAPKCERPTQTAGHDPAVLIDNVASAATVLGGSFIVQAGSAGAACVRRQGTTSNTIWQVIVDAGGGTFTLTVGANTTSALPSNETTANVQAALVALASVGTGNAVVAGVPGQYEVTFQGALAGTNVNITGTGTGLTGTNKLTGGAGAVYWVRMETGATNAVPDVALLNVRCFNYTAQYTDAVTAANSVSLGSGSTSFTVLPKLAAAALRPAVTGSKGANAALASLMTALAAMGLVTDSTT